MTVRSKIVRQDMEEGGTGEGEKWGMGEGNKKGRNGESIYFHGQHVTEFLTKLCMSAYAWDCMTMCTCIILIVNLPAE